MFLTKLCLINLLTRGGTILSSLLGGHTPALPSRGDRDLQEVAENKKSVGREAGEDRPPSRQCVNYLFPPRGCRKLQAPPFGVGPSSRADPLGFARGLFGQAGPRLQGLLVLLELGPEARVGLGHRAGALHNLQTKGFGWTPRSVGRKLRGHPQRPETPPLRPGSPRSPAPTSGPPPLPRALARPEGPASSRRKPRPRESPALPGRPAPA